MNIESANLSSLASGSTALESMSQPLADGVGVSEGFSGALVTQIELLSNVKAGVAVPLQAPGIAVLPTVNGAQDIAALPVAKSNVQDIAALLGNGLPASGQTDHEAVLGALTDTLNYIGIGATAAEKAAAAEQNIKNVIAMTVPAGQSSKNAPVAALASGPGSKGAQATAVALGQSSKDTPAPAVAAEQSINDAIAMAVPAGQSRKDVPAAAIVVGQNSKDAPATVVASRQNSNDASAIAAGQSAKDVPAAAVVVGQNSKDVPATVVSAEQKTKAGLAAAAPAGQSHKHVAATPAPVQQHLKNAVAKPDALEQSIKDVPAAAVPAKQGRKQVAATPVPVRQNLNDSVAKTTAAEQNIKDVIAMAVPNGQNSKNTLDTAVPARQNSKDVIAMAVPARHNIKNIVADAVMSKQSSDGAVAESGQSIKDVMAATVTVQMDLKTAKNDKADKKTVEDNAQTAVEDKSVNQEPAAAIVAAVMPVEPKKAANNLAPPDTVKEDDLLSFIKSSSGDAKPNQAAKAPDAAASTETVFHQQVQRNMDSTNLENAGNTGPTEKTGRTEQQAFSVEGEKTLPRVGTDIAPPAKLTAENKADVPAITKPITHPEWNKDLGERIVWMSSKAIPAAEIRLNPQHLGPISVRVDVADDQATVVFTAQHATTREAIEASIPKLKEMMGAQQLNLADVSVSQGSTSDHGRSQAQNFAQTADGRGQGAMDGVDGVDDVEQEIDSGRAVVSDSLLSIYA